MNLLRAELSRLRYRRRFMWSLVGVLLLSLAVPMLWMDAARPVTAAERAQARAAFETMLPGECLGCVESDFLRYVWTFTEVVDGGIVPFVAVMSLLTLVIVVAYAGSDFRSGAIATQLTFTPRRSALVVSRAAVAGLLGAAVMGIAAVTSTVVSAVWYVALNGFAAVGATPSLLAFVLAAVFYGGLLGVIGALLTMLGGGATLAAVAVLVVFILDVLTLTVGYDVPLPAWVSHLLPTVQADALLTGRAEVYGMTGQLLLGVPRPEAVLYHLVLVAVLAGVTVLAFERRDIKN